MRSGKTRTEVRCATVGAAVTARHAWPMLPLRRDRSDDHLVVLYLEKVFWTLVIATLALLVGGFLLSPRALLGSPGFVFAFGVCLVLWCLHAVQVHAHRDEFRHDMQAHRARERRGF